MKKNSFFYFCIAFITLAVFVFSLLLFPVVSYAQSSPSGTESGCPACTSTPTRLAKYFQFVSEAISIIQIAQQTKEIPDTVLAPNPSGGLPTAQRRDDLRSQLDRVRGILVQRRKQPGIMQGTFESIRNNTTKTKQTLQALTFLGKTFAFSNPGLGRSVIFKPKSIRRDREKLLNVDDKIQSLYFDLATEGILLTKLDQRQRTALLQLFEKYSTDDGFLIADTGGLQESVTFKDICKLLRTMNAAFKRFVTIGAVVERTSDEVKELQEGGIRVDLDRDKALTLRDDYRCSRQIGMCTSSFRKFGQAMKQSTVGIQQASEQSMREIRESIIALRFALQAKRYKKSTTPTQCTRDIDIQTGKERRKRVDGGKEIVYTFHTPTPPRKKPYWTKGSPDEDTSSHKEIAEKRMIKECAINTREIQAKPDERKMMDRLIANERTLLQSQFGLYLNQATMDRSIWGMAGQRGQTNQTDALKSEEKVMGGTAIDGLNESNAAALLKQNNKKEESIMQDIMEDYYDIDGGKIFALNTLEADFRQALFQTQQEQITMSQVFVRADVRPTMQLIGAMTQKVRYSTTLMGDKQNPASLYNLLGRSCSMQCGNLGGICRDR